MQVIKPQQQRILTYDSVGNVLTLTNGNGKVITYTYDQLSNVVSRMSSLGDKTQYTYNLNNQLEKITKSDGKTISYDYNKLDQLLHVEYSEKQDGQVLYTYDADGRRVSMSDLTGKAQYAYNDEGELLGVRQGDGSLIEYRYDEFGNIIQMVYPDGSQVNYTYDALDRLTSVTDTTGKKTTYHYNDAGDMFHISRGDGTQSYLTYDKVHRVSEIKHLDASQALISQYSYMYDDGGYITKETITQQGETVVQRYTYDTLGQIVMMSIEDTEGQTLSSLSYTYDLAGNKLTSVETVDGIEQHTQFKYDDNNRLVSLESADSTIEYTYDVNGNRISQTKGDEKINYVYDTENRLLAVKDNKGLLMSALYDGDSNRVFTASRKEGHYTYQLFQREDKKRSPKTNTGGEEHSLFWYGFTQNVLQSLASLPQTIGNIWHDLFDDVSTAYHQKVAKDKANKEGIVVSPPDLGHLPGEGDVVYASQVKDVLIPYTTKEDHFHYFEERNYVNDINQQHTQVLQTYNQELDVQETYTYGVGRNGYYNNQSKDNYHYLTTKSGTVTGLTKNGESVTNSQYQLYGGFKQTTDTTGNPFHYNGEARDVTGLDYLRARYYDTDSGTFLTQDTYLGSLHTPLSQNLYAYVKNNPVNYTDPSGHFWHHVGNFFNSVVDTAKNVWDTATEFVSNAWHATTEFVSNAWHATTEFVSNTWHATTNFVSKVWHSTTEYVSHKVNQVKQTVVSAYEQAKAAGESVYNWGKSATREAGNIAKNWTKSLEETIRHVCEVALRADGGIVYASGVDKIALSDAANMSLSQMNEASVAERRLDKYISENKKLRQLVDSIKLSSKTDIEKSEAIVRAYEDYLYNMNKEAFDDYWDIRKNNAKWEVVEGNFADIAEKNIGKKLQNSGIDIKYIMQQMGDDIISVNSNAPFVPFVATTKIQAKISDNYQFYKLVNTGQPLDLKSRSYQKSDNAGYSIWSRDWGGGVKNDYAGNYLYGYVGKGYLKTSDTYLKLAAGVAQEISDMKKMGIIEADIKAFKSFINGHYFDNPGDSKMIQDGIDDFKFKHRK